MKSICAWCKKDMGIVHSDTYSENVITHGICEECAHIAFAELNMDRMEIFIDRLPEPVLVVDGDLVALMANKKAREILGKDLPQIKGFKGGNIIECVHAREPGGCDAFADPLRDREVHGVRRRGAGRGRRGRRLNRERHCRGDGRE